jgi:hypothetical protein
MSTQLLERPGNEASPWEEDELWEEDEEPSVTHAPEPPLDALTRSRHAEDREKPKDDETPVFERLLFDELADELAEATRGLSSTRRATRHPAYAEILALGDVAIPWLLERLEMPGDRPLWLRLLGSLKHFQPGAGQDTISEAAAAWIQWGKLHRPH